MSKKITAAVSHHGREVAELRTDSELAAEYLKAAMESLDDPDHRAAGLLALRTVVEAAKGLNDETAEARFHALALRGDTQNALALLNKLDRKNNDATRKTQNNQVLRQRIFGHRLSTR